MHTEVLVRRKKYPEHKLTVETKSIKGKGFSSLGIGPWNNCVYLIFVKSDFPNIGYPEKKVNDTGIMKRQKYNFDYFNCDLAELGWHGGITYYQERLDVESDLIVVTAGADYQHYGDEHYQDDDNGLMILNNVADELVKEFLELNTRRNKEK